VNSAACCQQSIFLWIPRPLDLETLEKLSIHCFHWGDLSFRALHKGLLCVSRQLLISLCLRAFTVLHWPCCFRHLFEFYSHCASHCLPATSCSFFCSLSLFLCVSPDSWICFLYSMWLVRSDLECMLLHKLKYLLLRPIKWLYLTFT